MARSVLVHGMRLATLGLMIDPEISPCFGLRWCVKNHPKPRWDRELACECGAGTPCDYQRAKRQPGISKVIEWRHYDHRLRSRVPVGDGYRFAMSVSSPMSRSVQRLPTSTSAFATELEGSDETLFRPHEVNLKQRSGLMLIAQDRTNNGDRHERSYCPATATRIRHLGRRPRNADFDRDLLRDRLAPVAFSLDPG